MKRLLLCILLASSALFGNDDESDIIVLARNEVYQGDYFAYGKGIEISGTVNGDLYVFGAQVYIDGRVEGDIIVAGGSVTLTGTGAQDLRVAAGQMMMSGSVEGNATILAGNAELFPSASIGGNLVALVGNMDLGATIGNMARVNASNLRVSADIGGNLSAFVGHLRLTPRASVGGKVEYWSNKLALIASDAKIGEGIVHHPSFFYNLFQGKFFKSLKIGSKLATLLMNFFYSLLVGLILIRFFPQNIFRSVQAIEKKPLHALLAGGIVVIVLPIAFLILLVTILGAPFALTLLAVNVIGLYTAKIITIFFVTSRILRRIDFKRHLRFYYFCALLAYFAIVLIPFVGTVASIIAALLGLGGLVLGKMPQGEAEKAIR